MRLCDGLTDLPLTGAAPPCGDHSDICKLRSARRLGRRASARRRVRCSGELARAGFPKQLKRDLSGIVVAECATRHDRQIKHDLPAGRCPPAVHGISCDECLIAHGCEHTAIARSSMLDTLHAFDLCRDGTRRTSEGNEKQFKRLDHSLLRGSALAARNDDGEKRHGAHVVKKLLVTDGQRICVPLAQERVVDRLWQLLRKMKSLPIFGSAAESCHSRGGDCVGLTSIRQQDIKRPTVPRCCISCRVAWRISCRVAWRITHSTSGRPRGHTSSLVV